VTCNRGRLSSACCGLVVTCCSVVERTALSEFDRDESGNDMVVSGFDRDESGIDRDESGIDMVVSGFDRDESGEFEELPFVVWLCDFVNFEPRRGPARVGLSLRFDFTLGSMLVKSKISASVASSSLARTGVPFSRRNLISGTEGE